MTIATGRRGAARELARANRVGDLGLALLVLGSSALSWLIIDPRTPDLAAQVYRADLYEDVGFTVWDNNWYAGHHVPGYSLLFPPLADLFGLRAVGVLAVLASVCLFGMLARRHLSASATAATAWFAVAATGDLWIGRLTFALGVTLGLAAVLAITREQRLLGVLLAAACSAASPVAGLFLVLAGAAHVLGTRTARRGVLLGGPALVVALAMSTLFPEGGREPFGAASFAATLAAALAFMALMPRRERVLWAGGGLYVVAVVLSLLISSPMGSNVSRLAILFAWPVLIGRTGIPSPARRRRLIAVGITGLGLVGWAAWGPVREVAKVSSDRSVDAAYYQPVERFLATRMTTPARLEVPFTVAHWEATILAEHYPLARGWERQLDTRYDALFFVGRLTPAAYLAWLRAEAVRYVALSDAPLDSSSVQEAKLIRGGLPFLRLVFVSSHWHVYEVIGAAALARGPGTLTTLSRAGFTLDAIHAGAFTVQVRSSPYWVLSRGDGCVSPAPGGWTAVTVRHPGTLRVVARFSLARALGAGRACTRAG